MPEFVRITVNLTGAAADAAGESELEYALVPPAQLGTLLQLLGLRRPAVADVLAGCQIKLNNAPAAPDTLLSDGDVVQIDPT